jgi:integrase
MEKSIFTVPKLCKAAEGWYIYTRYQGKKKVYKYGINRIECLKEREIHANILKKALHDKLKNGWNPLIKVQAKKEMTFVEALNFALDKKKDRLAKKTFSGYKGTVSSFRKIVNLLSWNDLSVKEVKRVHIRTLAEKAKEEFKWSNKSYNKNLNYLSAVIVEVLKWDIIEHNPVYLIDRLPEEESTLHEKPTNEDHEVIKNELSGFYPYFNNFIATEYYTGIRPSEILSIQLEMINLDNNEIRLPPKITKSGTKKRNVVIPRGLKTILLSMELHKYPKDFYLFGSYRERGRGNVGKFIDFIPAPTPIKTDTATKRWRRIVKKGLGIDVTMYSYKRKGGDDKYVAGVSKESIQNQYGHSSAKMTDIYLKETTGVYKRDIIENTPDY